MSEDKLKYFRREMRKHWYYKKEQDEILEKIKSYKYATSKYLPCCCRLCKFAYASVDCMWCTFAGVSLENTFIDRNSRLNYCPLEIKKVYENEIK
jgi:hypothetical protein